MSETLDSWPAGSTWVFQGTVAEDGTGGTHVCTLTVTPGAGNEIELIGGSILDGNTATSQSINARVTDGTNELFRLSETAQTTALYKVAFPNAITGGISSTVSGTRGPIISGTMQLILQVSTAAISVTQTFAVVCRIKGAMPTATLADSVGTPVLTTNTNKVF